MIASGVAQRIVWPDIVIVPPPDLDDDLRLAIAKNRVLLTIKVGFRRRQRLARAAG